MFTLIKCFLCSKAVPVEILTYVFAYVEIVTISIKIYV